MILVFWVLLEQLLELQNSKIKFSFLFKREFLKLVFVEFILVFWTKLEAITYLILIPKDSVSLYLVNHVVYSEETKALKLDVKQSLALNIAYMILV